MVLNKFVFFSICSFQHNFSVFGLSRCNLWETFFDKKLLFDKAMKRNNQNYSPSNNNNYNSSPNQNYHQYSPNYQQRQQNQQQQQQQQMQQKEFTLKYYFPGAASISDQLDSKFYFYELQL